MPTCCRSNVIHKYQDLYSQAFYEGKDYTQAVNQVTDDIAGLREILSQSTNLSTNIESNDYVWTSARTESNPEGHN